MKKGSEAWPASSDRDLTEVTHCFTETSGQQHTHTQHEDTVMVVVVSDDVYPFI